MADGKEHVRDHYDRHANKHENAKQALAERSKGVAVELKKFHNEVKRQLLLRFACRAERLLDYACGRGGDLRKWQAARVQYVKGIDLSPGEIEEAERRYKELRSRGGFCPRVTFEACDKLGEQLVVEEAPFQVITCMFAIHYFFESQEVLNHFFENVATNLAPGGFFIGTVPDGKRVLAHLTTGPFISPCLNLTAGFQGKPDPLGASVTFEIKDTVVEGHNEGSGGSREYLVFTKVLESTAAKHGLHPVKDYQDGALDALFEEKDAGAWAKHFRPPFNEPKSLALASSLNMAFVFQKRGATDPVQLPPAAADQQEQDLQRKRRRDEAPRTAWPNHNQHQHQQQQRQQPRPAQQPPGGQQWHQSNPSQSAGPLWQGPGGPQYHAHPAGVALGGAFPPPHHNSGWAPPPGPGFAAPMQHAQGSRYDARWGVETVSALRERVTLPSAWLLSRYPEGRAGRFMVQDWPPTNYHSGPMNYEDYGRAQEEEKQRAELERYEKLEALHRRKQAAGAPTAQPQPPSSQQQQQQQQQTAAVAQAHKAARSSAPQVNSKQQQQQQQATHQEPPLAPAPAGAQQAASPHKQQPRRPEADPCGYMEGSAPVDLTAVQQVAGDATGLGYAAPLDL